MNKTARVLLIHDGELEDVAALLADLEADVVERRGRPTAEDQETVWKAVVGTPRYVLELQVGASGPKPVRMALLSGDSRTLIAMLRRSGVDLMVRRPVHPTALRLLLVHALYSGPEKRRHPRITIGAPVRFRSGLFRRQGTLADLSARGCRLLSSYAPSKGQKLKIQLPTALGCERATTIEGRVLRSGPTNGVGERQHATAITFDIVTPKQAAAVRSVLAAHARGPAVLEGAVAKTAGADVEVAPTEEAAPVDLPEVNERRETDRVDMASRRIIALGVEATRVLIGRDISLGGMRVEPNNQVKVGSEFKLAVHMRARQEPLVVSARATRDDGDDGMVLEFFDLSEDARSYLEKMVNFLPILAARGGDTGSGLIVSEILETYGDPPLCDASIPPPDDEETDSASADEPVAEAASELEDSVEASEAPDEDAASEAVADEPQDDHPIPVEAAADVPDGDASEDGVTPS